MPDQAAPAGSAAGRRSRRVFALMLLAAITLGAVGAGFGGWVGWQGAPPLPDDATASQLAWQVVPLGEPQLVERHDVLFGYPDAGSAAWLLGGDNYSGGYVKLLVTDGDPAPDQLSEIRTLLLAHRWRISSDLVGQGMSGSKGRLSVRVYPATFDGTRVSQASPDDAVAIEFGRSQPARVPTFTVIGCLLGLALGWFGSGWLVGRAVRAGVRRWPVLIALVAGLVLLLPGTVLTAGQLVFTVLFMPNSMPSPPAWGEYLLPGVRTLATLGVLCLAGAGVATVRTDRLPAR